MSAKRARKPLGEVSVNTIPNQKRRKLSVPKKRATAADAVDLDDATAMPKVPKKRAKALVPPVTAPPEQFVPLHQVGGPGLYSSNTCIPEGTEHTPYAYFSLFWDNCILQQIADATNAYALAKCTTATTSWQAATASGCQVIQRQWKPVTPCELRRFLSALVFMGYTRSTPRQFAHLRHCRFLPKGSISQNRYDQTKRYFHISDPTVQYHRKDWWKKVEPLSSHLRSRPQQYFQPQSNVALDELMSKFKGRSAHTVRIPSKPISEGYKILALCDAGYTLNWLFTSHTESIAEHRKDDNLTVEKERDS